jgi:hypothetical protein
MDASFPTASLQSILCTEELQRRPSRLPDYRKENRALVAQAGALFAGYHASDVTTTP